ncbi:hypothetical protein GQ457_12G017900 [Hibiscus cannabinus]
MPFRGLELATKWKESKEHGIATRPSPFYCLEIHYVLYVLYDDKASLLSDVVSYINDLKAKIEELESQLQRECKKVKVEMVDNTMDNQSTTTTSREQTARPSDSSSGTEAGTGGSGEVELDVKIMGNDAMIRVQSENVNYPGSRLMGVVCDLEFQLHHASMSCVNDLMLQDIVVRVPDGLRTEEGLKSALMSPKFMANLSLKNDSFRNKRVGTQESSNLVHPPLLKN